jgi:hypothetical protein
MVMVDEEVRRQRPGRVRRSGRSLLADLQGRGDIRLGQRQHLAQFPELVGTDLGEHPLLVRRLSLRVARTLS